MLHVRVYRDLNGNGYRDTGEPGERDIKVSVTPGPGTKNGPIDVRFWLSR